MPFVQRIIEPKYLSRTSLWDVDGNPRVRDGELEAVTNNTLSNALRQLASLVLAANDIFVELRGELRGIAQRSEKLKSKIDTVEGKVAAYDPKKVTVPESDICSFARLKTHYAANYGVTTDLFSSATRPRPVQELYAAAAKTPIHLMRQMDKWRRDGHRSSRFFLCTPVLGARRRKIRSRVDIDIETRMPAAVEELRRWTSNEAIGDVTITPDCQNRIPPTSVSYLQDGDVTDGTALSDEEPLDHKLPSPEEQAHVLAMKFPPEVVAVDISGRSFDRLSVQRRSLLHTEPEDGSAVRRKGRTRKPRNRRRNTIAGTDQKELRDAVSGGEETTSPTRETEPAFPEPVPVAAGSARSKSSDFLRSTSKKDSPDQKKSHFNSLKQWGKNRLKMINKYATETKSPEDKEETNTYETISSKRRSSEKKPGHERQTSCSSSSEKSSISNNGAANVPLLVKLRDSSQQKRLRRSGDNKDEMHSSSGNWSASSESGRASIGSEITTHPKSTTSAATSSNSLNTHPPGSVNSRRRYTNNTSTSGSVTSEGTLTPDIIHDLHEDGETSSVYSCDTEGYYTSFHMDSGLKTLKEEDGPVTPLHSTTAFNSSSAGLTAENEYELFGRGSTSTTTSSAGTVCTTLRASESSRSLTNGPAVPERKSSLNKSTEKSPESSLERDGSSDRTGTVKRSPLNHKPAVVGVVCKKEGDVLPDSGHNTSNSPVESSPNGRSCSEFEYSESSDMEGADRLERIRTKTAINSSRIPSMCAITPPHSDDENYEMVRERNTKNRGVEQTNLDEVDILKEASQTKKVQVINVNPISGYATIETIDVKERDVEKTKAAAKRAPSPSGGTVTVNVKEKSPQTQPIFKATLMPLNNMLGKLRNNLSNLRKSPGVADSKDAVDSGEYVTISDVKNNNNNLNNKSPIYDSINKNLKAVLSGKIKETEYVSLNELPLHENESDSLDRGRRQGARVTLNAEGKVVYSSDSLPRRKGASTFEPGPFVKSGGSPTQSPLPAHRNNNVRPVNTQDDSRPLSPQLGKVVIRASSGITEIVRMPPSAIVTPTSPKPVNSRGAYVHVLGDAGRVHLPSNQAAAHSMDSEFGYADFIYPCDTSYSTLPARKIHRGLWDGPERSVTPDITRDLGSARNQARQYRPRGPQEAPLRTADDSLKISPIDPKSTGMGFKASTPAPKATELRAAVNLDSALLSPKRSTMSNEELYAVIHKSKKKLNISEEEIDRMSSPVDWELPAKSLPKSPETGYLGEKSRNRLSWSPGSDDLTDLKDRFSNESGSRQSWACKDRKGTGQTSRLDFKKLLLQHSKQVVPSKNNKLSAVEQLKLSKQQIQPTPKLHEQDDMSILELSRSPRSLGNRKCNTINSPRGTPDKPARPVPKLLSPRSQWRFASPRSDVLSSTIPEDCREDESPNSSGERRSRGFEENKAVVQNLFGTSQKKITERIQAQRAQFFGSTSTTNDCSYRNRQIPEKSVLPTLETAF